MIVTQVYGLASGLGTIDRCDIYYFYSPRCIFIHDISFILPCILSLNFRMQLKRGQALNAKAIPFNHVFGDSMWRYFVPVEPYFSDPESVYHYRVPGYSSSRL